MNTFLVQIGVDIKVSDFYSVELCVSCSIAYMLGSNEFPVTEQ